jgi:hypothetical protein
MAELLWASVREVRNIFQADLCGSHIVTVPHDILTKALKMVGTDLTSLSLDTVKMFAGTLRQRALPCSVTSREERGRYPGFPAGGTIDESPAGTAEITQRTWSRVCLTLCFG